jgi:hypothetical protein
LCGELDIKNWRSNLGNRLVSLSEQHQRNVVFTMAIEKLDPPDAAATLEAILKDAFTGRSRPAKLLAEAAMLILALNDWPLEHRHSTLESALDSGLRLSAIMLCEVTGETEEDDLDSFETPDYAKGRPLTLGERRTLASRPDRQLLEKALNDPHPMVIEKLLSNPRLVEQDVIFIATRRPVPAAVLANIALHNRWRTSPAIARALVNNPMISLGTGLSLLYILDSPLTTNLIEDKRITPLLREAMQAFLDFLIQE